MRKLMAFAMVIMMLTAMLAGCSQAEGKQEQAQGKPGVVYLCMNLGDNGFNDNGWAGVQAAAQKYNLEPEVVELGEDSSTYEAAMLDLCDSGKYAYMVTQSNNNMMEFAMNCAKEFSDMKFIVFDAGTDVKFETDNIIGTALDKGASAFMVGAIGAAVSKTGAIGMVCYLDVPAANDVVTGFIDGVKAYDESYTVKVVYANGFDPAVYVNLTNTLYDSGVDVVYGFGVSDAVHQAGADKGGAEAGFYTIGITVDEYAKFLNSETPALASPIITSSLEDISASIVGLFGQIFDNTAQWGTVTLLGLEENAVGYADNEQYQKYVPQEGKDMVEDLKAKIMDGTITPKSYYDFADYDAFVLFRDSAG